MTAELEKLKREWETARAGFGTWHPITVKIRRQYLEAQAEYRQTVSGGKRDTGHDD